MTTYFLERLVNKTLNKSPTVSINPAITPYAVPNPFNPPTLQFGPAPLTSATKPDSLFLDSTDSTLAKREPENLHSSTNAVRKTTRNQNPASTKAANKISKFGASNISQNNPDETSAKSIRGRSPNTNDLLPSVNRATEFPPVPHVPSPKATKRSLDSKVSVIKHEEAPVPFPPLKEGFATTSNASLKKENAVEIKQAIVPQVSEDLTQNAIQVLKNQKTTAKPTTGMNLTKEKLEATGSEPNINPSKSHDGSQSETTEMEMNTSQPLPQSTTSTISTFERVPTKERAENSQVSAEPTVTIHIGRIGVHAATPPKAISQGRTPILSLKEYLKRRAEESR